MQIAILLCELQQNCGCLLMETSAVNHPPSLSRNNTPDRQKLRAKLNRRRGLRAYACQCSWFSALDPTDLRGQPQLTWVCSKHR